MPEPVFNASKKMPEPVFNASKKIRASAIDPSRRIPEPMVDSPRKVLSPSKLVVDNAFGLHTTFKDGGQVHSVPIQPLKDGGQVHSGSHTTFKDGGADALENALENAFKGHSCPLR